MANSVSTWPLKIAGGFLLFSLLAVSFNTHAQEPPAEEPKKEPAPVPRAQADWNDIDKMTQRLLLMMMAPNGNQEATRKAVQAELQRMQKELANVPGAAEMLKQMADLDAELDAIRRMIPPARMQIQGGGIVGFANLGGMGGFGGMLPGFGGLPGGFGGMVPGNNPFIPNGVPPINIEPRLGITVQKPMPIIIDQLDLPVGQGIIIQEMVPNGLAAKAGLKVHDILLEIGGKSVPSVPADFISTLRDMKADAPVDLVLLRKGRKETIKGIEFIDAPKVEAPAPLPPLRRGNSESSSVQIINNQFTIEYGSGELQIVIRGMIADRQPTPEAITIRDGDKQTEYKALKDVPEAYQETVTRALKSIKVR